MNAFSQLHPEEALEQAEARAEAVARGEPTGPLHGVPIAVKDLFDVAGWETSGCCRAYMGNVAAADSAVVRRLRSAGAVIVGKTNQHELAAGGTNAVSACGPTRNPWDVGRLTGGSSGGSAAAVAARIVPAAMGSDTGGSVRIPASFCGVTGLKPTFGRVSLDGAMPLAPSLDTAGPLASSAEDVALLFAAVAERGPRFLEEAAAPVGGLRIGVAGGFFADRVQAQILAARDDVRAALEAAGARASGIDVGEITDSPDVWNRIAWTEFASRYERLLRRPDALYARTRELLEYGARGTGVDLVRARERQGEIRGAFLAALEEVDALLVPATPFPAPPWDAERRVVNLTPLPALALPSGFSADGLPLGVQLIGRQGEEALLLRVAAAIQRSTGHHERVPSPPA